MDQLLCEPKLHGQRDQLLLGPVVQVPFELPPFLVLRGDEPLSRSFQLFDRAEWETLRRTSPACDERSATSCSSVLVTLSPARFSIDNPPSKSP